MTEEHQWDGKEALMHQPDAEALKHCILRTAAHAYAFVHDTLEAELARCGCDEHARQAVRLACDEALVNALGHGNQWNDCKHVFIAYACTPEWFYIAIEDEGTGFSRAAVPDPTLEENLTKASGRGLLLMEHYMEEVTYRPGNRGGTRVQMWRGLRWKAGADP